MRKKAPGGTIKRGRVKSGGSSSAPSGGGGAPSWKPAKSSVSGNYGKAVSEAAHARNAARKTARLSPAPSTGGGMTSPGQNLRRIGSVPSIGGGGITSPGQNLRRIGSVPSIGGDGTASRKPGLSGDSTFGSISSNPRPSKRDMLAGPRSSRIVAGARKRSRY